MSGIFGFHTREAIRVKVKETPRFTRETHNKCESHQPSEYRKFSVDPQITSFEVLQSLLARAFDIKGEFTISYLAKDEDGKDTHLSLLSDWDLDAAFLGSSDPCLELRVDLKPFEEGMEDWDVITPVDIPRTQVAGQQTDRPSITGTILTHMEKTLNLVQRALNLGDNENNPENFRPPKPPMVDSEFRIYLDGDGRLVKPKELRLSVYQGGIEASFRKVAWKHILNVYPNGLAARERITYMKQKALEYQRIRDVWQDMIAAGNITDEIQYVTNMVRKDVLRTDRTHKFYAGSDDNKNVVSLFNILTTYALNHPNVSYCQGMSDLASPILVTMKDEGHAYICFCALMHRLKSNFYLDGKSMTVKFQHLSELLEYYDPHFFEYLKNQGADDLLFCYRWLLLELKREFAFDDALRMLEVLWSSLPPLPPSGELPLFEEQFTHNTIRHQTPRIHSRENPYTKVRAIRKQNSASSIRGLMKGSSKDKEDHDLQHEHEDISIKSSDQSNVQDANNMQNNSLKEKSGGLSRRNSATESTGDESQEYLPMTTSITRELRMELENLNRHLPGSYLHRSLTVDSEDLDSPRSPEGCDLSRDEPHSCQYHQPIVIEQSMEEDAPDSQSWTSDEISGADQIRRVGSARKMQKCPEYLQLNGAPETNVDLNYCCTPDEQCDIEFDVQPKTVSDIPCNGEILENEESEETDGCARHLKSVIPIRLVHSPVIDERHKRHDSDSSDSISEDCAPKVEVEQQKFSSPSSNNQSEGYGSESTLSSKETSMRADSNSIIKSHNGFLDSGIVESVMTNSCEEALEFSGKPRRSTLPPPHELGGGNPFMLFLCLTLLLQHREVIMKSGMDYNELAMHFDKRVRKHNVNRVLHQARAMFAEYLQMGWQEGSWESSSDPQV